MSRPIELPISPMRLAPNRTTTMARMIMSSAGPRLWKIRNGISSPPCFYASSIPPERGSANQSGSGPLREDHQEQEERSQAGGGEPPLPDAGYQEEHGARARYGHAGDD